MATQFQGFDKKLNLKEATADRDIFNNLAGFPVGDDIGLFVNNLRNESILVVAEENIVGDTIVFTGTTPFIYTNGTVLKVEANDSTLEEDLVVTDSISLNTGEKSFKLRNSENNPVTSPLAGVYVRNDGIVNNNLVNLRKPHKVSVEDPDTSLFPVISEYPDVESVDRSIPGYVPVGNIFSSFFELLNTTNTYGQDYEAVSEELNTNIDNYNVTLNESIIGNLDFSTDRSIELNGSLYVSDEGGLNKVDQDLSNNNPGIYIYNVVTEEIRRIFSSNDNVWSEDSLNNYLVCASKEIVIGGSLVFEGPIQFTTPSLGSLVSPISGVIDVDFTHLARVIINGEEYFVCLLETEVQSTS